MAPIRMMFAGGGDETASLPLDQTFAGWVGHGRLLYLPSALVHPSNKQAGVRWLQQTLTPLGVKHIDAWLTLSGKTAQDLEGFDAVYLGGGNTFFLLQQLRQHRLDLALEAFALSGRPVYGGSAGAIVLGYDITSAAHIDENIIGVSDLTGLDLALGYSIWCHYTLADDDRIQAYVKRTGIPSLALSERSGVFREGDHLVAAGYDPVIHFTLQGRSEVVSGEHIL